MALIRIEFLGVPGGGKPHSMWKGSLRILVVIAHMDDATYFCGGSLVRWAQEGHEIYLAVLTDGSKGSIEAVDPQQLAEARRQEQLEALKLIGAQEAFFFNYPDGELNRATDVGERLVLLYRKLRPHVLITQDPWKRYELHPDHRACGMAALDAQLPAKLPTYFPHQLTDETQPWAVNSILLYHSDEPNLWMDVSKTVRQKFKVLFTHRSQFSSNEAEIQETLEQEMIEWGRKINVDYAEAFKRIELDSKMLHVKIY